MRRDLALFANVSVAHSMQFDAQGLIGSTTIKGGTFVIFIVSPPAYQSWEESIDDRPSRSLQNHD
jgi:hypothetical protein